MVRAETMVKIYRADIEHLTPEETMEAIGLTEDEAAFYLGHESLEHIEFEKNLTEIEFFNLLKDD